MTKQLLTLGVVTVLGLTLANVASAQLSGYGTDCNTHGNGHGYAGGGYYQPFGGYHSSTYEEGVLRGLGSLQRSIGERNYFNSLASINFEDAKAKALVNSEKRTETYFRLKQINAAARQIERPSRMSPEEYVALAKRQAPDRLSEVDYDRTLGRLTWPAALESDEFAAERDVLDAAFAARRPNDTGVASQFHGLVRQLTNTLQSKLQGRLTTLSPMEFIAAEKFLTGLAYESQLPLDLAAVASK